MIGREGGGGGGGAGIGIGIGLKKKETGGEEKGEGMVVREGVRGFCLITPRPAMYVWFDRTGRVGWTWLGEGNGWGWVGLSTGRRGGLVG